MAKVTVTFLKHYMPYAKDDVTVMEEEQANKLSVVGILKLGSIRHAEGGAPVEPLKGENIKGEKYDEGTVDVVIPTKDENKVEKLKKIQSHPKVRSGTVIERTFNRKNGGFAKACNDCAKPYENLGEFILFLNDDVEIADGFIDDLLKPFEDKSVALVGCESSKKQWGVNGAVMCVRREVFERVGGFDENYFFMWEDRDLCENITRRGYRIAISQAQATHKGGASTKRSKFYDEHYKNGQAYFEKKWNDEKRIIGGMTLGNEEGKYLEIVVPDLFARNLIDELVVILDNPTDNTPDIMAGLAEKYPITIYHHHFSLFGTAQNILRKRLIEYIASKNPYGILTPDADEVFDEDFSRQAINDLLKEGIGWDFRIAHFWGDFEHVRVDGIWKNQKNVRLFRYLPTEFQDFTNKPIHCGSGPWYAYKFRKSAPYLFKHYGYVRKVDIEKKVERYAKFDPNGNYETIDWYRKMKEEGNIVKYNKKIYI